MSANKMIAFESMLNVLKLGLQRIGCIRAIESARSDGQVTTTLAFHRELLSVEEELGRSVAICKRTAGEENAAKVMTALGIGQQEEVKA